MEEDQVHTYILLSFAIFFLGYWWSKHHLYITKKLRHRDRHRRSHTHAGSSGCHFGTARKETAQERLDYGIIHLQWTVHKHCL